MIADGVERDIDVGDVEGATFIGIASAGFDSEANRIANEAPSWLGQGVYAYGALRALIAWKPARFELELDGRHHSFTGYSVAAANSRAYGGGMFLAPDAELDDGMLDVVIVRTGFEVELPEGAAQGLQGRARQRGERDRHARPRGAHLRRPAVRPVRRRRPDRRAADGRAGRAGGVRVLSPRDGKLAGPRGSAK